MQALNMENAYRVLLSDVNSFRIMLVGLRRYWFISSLSPG